MRPPRVFVRPVRYVDEAGSLSERAACRQAVPRWLRIRRVEVVGRGADAFERARRMLLDYTFYPPEIVSAEGPILAGMTLHQRVRAGPLHFDGPVRVLDLWDEPARAGFRYEATEGHVEEGVAEFEVWLDGDEVLLRIESRSAMRHWLARLGHPVARWFQRRAIEGAYRRMREAASFDASRDDATARPEREGVA